MPTSHRLTPAAFAAALAITAVASAAASLATTPAASAPAAAPAAPAASAAAETATPASPFAPLAAHRAIYDLTLGDTKGSSSVESIRGRIVYDFSGDACRGYALKFRQVTEIATSGGGSNMSDLRSTTLEDDAGKTFKFQSENWVNDRLDTKIDGHAERGKNGLVAVDLSKPKPTRFDLPQGVVFPTGQTRAIVEAAEAGNSVYESRVYDGSDGGEKTYS